MTGGGFVAVRGNHTYGTYVLAEPDGAAHLHDKDIPTAWEQNYYKGGDDDGVVRCETLGATVGLMSGWEWARNRTSGRVRAFKKGTDGKQNPLGDLKEGAFFGEMSILTGQPRMASVVALARCELLELDRPTLDEITKSHPHVWDVLREFAEQRRAAAQG